ncbi:MAG TPA: hypothetical protein VK404_10690 [Spirosoma sp.]|nr:hypothetical protein [Spirosoma sp.]
MQRFPLLDFIRIELFEMSVLVVAIVGFGDLPDVDKAKLKCVIKRTHSDNNPSGSKLFPTRPTPGSG